MKEGGKVGVERGREEERKKGGKRTKLFFFQHTESTIIHERANTHATCFLTLCSFPTRVASFPGCVEQGTFFYSNMAWE